MFKYESDTGEFRSCELRFLGVEAYKCTYLTSLTVDMIESAYDELVDMGETVWLAEAKLVAQQRGQLPNLKHLRICFDDGPCYEFICLDFELTGV